MGDKGYALNLLSPVRHVATVLDGAAPAALSVAELAATYSHSIPSDLSRIQEHEHQPTKAAATQWLIQSAVDVLARRGTGGRLQVEEVDGKYRLVVPFDELRYQGEKLIRTSLENDDDARRELRKVYADLGAELADREFRAFWVHVQGPRGGIEERRLYLHPLAWAIPQVNEKEFGELAADVRAHGVRNPITLFDGKVLDGRHRLAIAAALKVPLRVVTFEGTEDEARDEVISQNVARRHLTPPQRTLIVQELFLPQAEAEAKERMAAGGGDHRSEEARTGVRTNAHPASAQEPDTRTAVRAKEVAVERSGGLTTVRSLQTMDPVRQAPQTQEKIRQGKVKTLAGGRREALKEQGRDPAEPTPVAQPRAAYDRLGCALGDVRSAHDSLGEGRVGNVGTDKVRARIDEIRGLLDKMVGLL